MSNFEFDGCKYMNASKHQKEWGNKIISELNLKGDENILDLGCGDGVLTKQLCNMVPQGYVLGIDASKGMLDTAKKSENKNLKFQLMDINDLNFSNEFDLIFSNATLHWIKDHKKLLVNCHTALKSGGIIRFNFAGDGNCTNFFAVVKEVIKYEDFHKYFEKFQWPWYMPTIEEYKSLAKDSNFANIDVCGENTDRYFDNADEMTRWIDQPSLVPFLKQINDEKDRKIFRDKVVKTMIERTQNEAGKCFETFRRINIFAGK
ncbi:Methyltransferase type 11 [groundwater metagenome]|uniref:Methyltransferase type 11 n=1 Tax=groundwater metagenome TaxID=717931 RepID=A0A098E9E7_9ZZZZ